ncbi:MAG: ergothioneine biosynthesis protein EgtB [Leptospira sp.]|nr:ergothioneine biosynthesis protein EgtB [Leptospira sp.]
MLEKFHKTRNHTIDIMKPLITEDYIPQAVDFVSPPKWHLGHTTWFFEEFILNKFFTKYKPFHPKFGFLFNSYYNSFGARTARNMRGLMTRPSVSEVYKYREFVDLSIAKLISELTSLDSKDQTNEILAFIELGIHHEMQHQELFFTDLKYNFHLNPLYPVYKEECYVEDASLHEKQWISISQGNYEIGHKGSEFSFDNELGRHLVYLNDFAIQDELVSNQDFIEFIEDEGYSKHELWLDEGWSWLQQNNIKMPMYWQKVDSVYYQYTLAGLRKVLGQNILTHINYYEASAFANWKKLRLPTEFEWEIASNKFNWGKRWEWTSSAYLPYPKFEKREGSVGEYNGKFMVNQMVLRGASTVTPEGHSRSTYRNFFHPQIGYQFNGIRLAQG